MAMLTGSWIFDFFSILTALAVVAIAWIQWAQQYWSRRGIYSPPVDFFYGHSKKIFTQQESVGDFILEMYNKIKAKNVLHGGTYFLFKPVYIPIDPDLIKQMMATDFNHFVDRGIYINEKDDPLSAHLFSLEGTPWRNLRQKVTPTFTSGKMKMMFETLVKCGDQLTIEMDKLAGKESILAKDILQRFTIDIIGSCAFGIDCNSLKDPNTEFMQNANLFFIKNLRENLRDFVSFIFPSLAEKFRFRVTKKSLEDFFMKVVRDTVEYREKNNVYRKDFMHLLLQLKNRGEIVDDENVINETSNVNDDKVRLTLNQLAAQAFVFFLAGFETSSTTMTFALFELSQNREVQEKLRQEVIEVLSRHNKQLSYEAILEMHYMEQVINETLRKFPPLPNLNRICTKDYQISGTDLLIKKGSSVLIPVIGLHYDEKYYPNPQKFNPERFNAENKRNLHPYTYLPFGEGPRNCIGLRFGMMQTKAGLSVLIKNYKFSLSKRTELPIKFDEHSFILTAKGGIYLDYEKI